MILGEDVRANDGSILLAKGHQLTPSTTERLNNLAKTTGVVEPIRVVVPNKNAHTGPIAAKPAS